MLKRILIANRGEIAMRIIRAARQLDIETVLVYSSEDADSMPIKFATKCVCIGAASPSKSYLNQESVLQTAISQKCDAIHPGYGFLSENPDFAEKCEKNGIKLIGPSSAVIRKMGDKQTARRLMKSCSVPTVPGSDGVVESVKDAKEIADRIGYPILFKATAGGGGRGMRVANCEGEVDRAFNEATSEALSSFGDGRLYIEKLISHARHIEVQILGDEFGNLIHLGERDCSLQRRNQKVLEEAPAYCLDQKTQNQLRSVALKAARAVGYTSAGTVEFVLDQDCNFYFIEMNTRIQVEHPVSEMLTGVDIVREQLLIASGELLSINQDNVFFNGASIECRINAEDPSRNFAPSPGSIQQFMIPCGEGVRVETYLQNGSKISPWYDSMVAKIIVHAPERKEAIRKMITALDEMKIEGISTNIAFLKEILKASDFIEGRVDTTFISTFLNTSTLVR